MRPQRYTARIERMADGTWRARVAAFGGFEVTADTREQLEQCAPAALDAHIDELQRLHEPVISSAGLDFEGPL